MRIGIFGCGNMGAAIAEGFNKFDSKIEQYFYTPSKTKAQDLAKKLQGHFVENIHDMPKDLDWYVLGFKPQSINDFDFTFLPHSKILSVLAGTSIEKLSKKFETQNIARLMPNIPSAIGEGANLFYAPFDVFEMNEMLRGLGKVFIMKTEAELDAITAFSGSGPALLFEFGRIFEKYLNQLAGQNQDAREIVAQTFLGSAKMMENAIKAGTSFEALREQVTSKRGVTHEALQILEKNGVDNIMGGAFMAAYKRTIEIKKGI